MTGPRGRYVSDVTAGMWVRSWRGWRLVEQTTTDQLRMITLHFTLHFTDGTATALRPADIITTCDHNPEESR